MGFSNSAQKSLESKKAGEKPALRIIERIEVFLSILNQICIGFVTIYMLYLCWSLPFDYMEVHVGLVTVGFSLLMAEAIMCHYNNNVLTTGYKRKTKTTIHWVLMLMGGACGCAGALVMLINKGFKLHNIHSKLGFSAFILCLVSMLSGALALFSATLKKILSPILNKTFHNTLGIGTFVIALVTQYYGYHFYEPVVVPQFVTLLRCLTIISICLTCIGPLKALHQKIKNIVDA